MVEELVAVVGKLITGTVSLKEPLILSSHLICLVL